MIYNFKGKVLFQKAKIFFYLISNKAQHIYQNFFRITDDDNPRITDDNHARITDNSDY